MAAFYILYTFSKDQYYIGSCANLAIRIEQHKNKEFDKSFTALRADDWELFFSVEDLEFEQARRIERHVKAMKSRKYIENLAKLPEIVKKLKMKYKGSGSSR